jgi:hypothetical protein
MKKSLFVAAAAVAVCVSAAAQAGTVGSYQLSDVTFDDGGTASGTFSFDFATSMFTTYSFVTTPGTKVGGFDYTPDNSQPQITPGSPEFPYEHLGFYTPVGNTHFLMLTLNEGALSASDSPGTNLLTAAEVANVDVDPPQASFSTGGTLSAAPVPVPASGLLLLTALSALGIGAIRRANSVV